MEIKNSTLYSFTYKNKDYFLYNNNYYNTEFIQVLDTFQRNEFQNLKIESTLVLIEFLCNIHKKSLYNYRIVKYKDNYFYFDRFMPNTEDYCELIRIDKNLVHLINIKVNYLQIIKDETIIEQQLMLYNLFLLFSGQDFNSLFLPKPNKWYEIEYFDDDTKEKIYGTLFLLGDDYIINNEYIHSIASCYQGLTQLTNKLIPIKNILCIYKENQTDTNYKYINENETKPIIRKGDFIFTNDNQYCIIDEYIGNDNYLAQTITKSFEVKQINLSDIKGRIIKEEAILSCKQIYGIQKWLKDKDKNHIGSFPKANKLYRIKFYNPYNHKDDVYYVYDLSINKISGRIHMSNVWSMNFMAYFNDITEDVKKLKYIEEVSHNDIPTEFKEILTKNNIIL